MTEVGKRRRWVRRLGSETGASESGSEGVKLGALPGPLVDVIRARGVATEEAARDWFQPTLKSLRNPSLLVDCDKAVQRLLAARAAQESIVLYADYDLDGTSGLALTMRAFQQMGFQNVHHYQPQRLTEGYGLHSEAIARLKEQTNCSLLISIDLGITAMEEVETAKALGIDVVITDHHLPKRDDAGDVVLPQSLAVVNPNRGDDQSGLGHLCGTGVIFYVILALRRALLEEGLLESEFDPKTLLDCFAIGTITDLVPLLAENRVLVKHGLLRLAETDRPGLRELLKELGLWGRPLTAQDVAIRFAPKLNALSRMGAGIQPLDLYLERDAARARELVSRVLSNNQDRQASQKLADDEADRLLKEEARAKEATGFVRSAVVIASDKFHRGVVGLVATRLSGRLGLPAFIGAIEDETGSIIGSARLPNGSSLNLLEAMSSASDCLDQFGGHAMAAGFEARRDRFPEFARRLSEWFAQQAGSDLSESLSVLEYDAECYLRDLNSSFMAWHAHLGPYGSQSPVPLFRFNDCLVAQVRELKGGHLRLKLAQIGANSVQAIWFSPPKMNLPRQGDRVSIIAEVQWNHFQGARQIQLLIQDLDQDLVIENLATDIARPEIRTVATEP